MKWKDTIFAAVAAIIPTIVSNLVKNYFSKETELARTLVSGIIIFSLLLIVQLLLNAYKRLNKFCGQWVEEMIEYDMQNVQKSKYIGIGIIRYDRSTGEHTFAGKTYSLSGTETYTWAINYLREEKDDSMQYVCSVQIPSERSIGQITFYSKDECEGTIWCMDGKWYKYNAYRITPKMVIDLGLRQSVEKRAVFPWYKGMVISQKNCPEFINKYSAKNFP